MLQQLLRIYNQYKQELNNMKILILVLSHLEDGYESFIDMQKKTWDSIEVPGIETFFYYASKSEIEKPNEWNINCDGSLENTYNKMILAFKRALDYQWDYLFRTNSTSYVVKSELLKMYSELDPLNTIGGQLGPYPHCFKKTGHIQGFSVMISRDIVQLLVDKYPEGKGIDVEVMSRYLFDNENIVLNNKHYIHGVESTEDVNLDNPTHLYRINKATDLQGRLLLMEQIHNHIISHSSQAR